MTVIDASAMVETLIGRDPDSEMLDARAADVAAPHLLDVEVLSALGGLLLGGTLAGRFLSRDVCRSAVGSRAHEKGPQASTRCPALSEAPE